MNIKNLGFDKGVITDSGSNKVKIIPVVKEALKYLQVGYKDECCNETFCPDVAPCELNFDLQATLPLLYDEPSKTISIQEADINNDGYLSAANFALFLANQSKWALSGVDIINTNAGNVGIGATPTEKLHVAGNILFSGNRLYNSMGLLAHAGPDSNSTFFGRGAGATTEIGTLTGGSNTAFGRLALYSATSANNNVAIGTSSGAFITTAVYSTLVGRNTGISLNGTGNTLIGARGSDADGTSGNNNTTLGYGASIPVINSSNQLNITNCIYGINLTGTTGAPVGSIGINVLSPAGVFDVVSITDGSLPFPRMTQAQRLAIATLVVGKHVYQTDATEGVYVYKSSGWVFAY